MKKILATLLFAITSTTAMAAETAGAPVTSLTYNEGGNLFFSTSAPKINPGNCQAGGYVIPSNNPHISRYFALLLAAQSSGDKVRLRIQGCITVGSKTYPGIKYIRIIS